MVGYGRLLESVGGKVSIRLPLFSQAAGRWPSWVTQMRGVLFNVKPSLSEKAAGHLPLWGPTNTVDAGQISAFPAAFQPEASKANRNGTVSWDILARGQVACVLGSVYASEPEYAPRGPCSPHPTLPAFCSAWPPCLHCVCVLRFPPSHNHKDHCMGQTSPCLSFFASLCVLSFPPYRNDS